MSGLALGGNCITAVHRLTWRGSSLHILMEPSPAPAQRCGDLQRSLCGKSMQACGMSAGSFHARYSPEARRLPLLLQSTQNTCRRATELSTAQQHRGVHTGAAAFLAAHLRLVTRQLPHFMHFKRICGIDRHAERTLATSTTPKSGPVSRVYLRCRTTQCS
jgi:hypothetical protein